MPKLPQRSKRYGNAYGIIDDRGELLIPTIRPTKREAVSSMAGSLPNRSDRWKDFYRRGYRCVRVWMTYWYPSVENNPIDFPKRIKEEMAKEG